MINFSLKDRRKNRANSTQKEDQREALNYKKKNCANTKLGMKEMKNGNYYIKHETVSLTSFKRQRFSDCIEKFNNCLLTKQYVIKRLKIKYSTKIYQSNLNKRITWLAILAKVELKAVSMTLD